MASSAPDRPLGKPMKFSIFDDPDGLAAGAEAIQHDGGEPFGSGINGGGHAGGSGADDGQIHRFSRTMTPDAGALGQLAKPGIEQQLSVAAFDHG